MKGKHAMTYEKVMKIKTKTGGTTVSLGSTGKNAMLGYGAKGRR